MELVKPTTISQEQKLKEFAFGIVERQKASLVRAKDTSIKSISFDFVALDLDFGMNSQAIDKIRVSYTREHINKIIAGLLSVSVSEYVKIVIPVIEDNKAYTEYNKEVKRLLRENKHLLLKA
jgi:hypothetical protein